MSELTIIQTRSKQNQVAPKDRRTTAAVPADNPIKDPNDDVLGRKKSAQNFANLVLQLDASEGAVVGVIGPWGSGKTSFINMAQTHWRQNNIKVLNFNPWMFSGTQQLVELFFAELSRQMRESGKRFAKVGELLQEYGEIFSTLSWVPHAGQYIERTSQIVAGTGKILQHRYNSLEFQRKYVVRALSARKKPILVVLDDIDRLTESEIRDVFKLVRLTANFPKIIYVTAFDRKRVEEALSEENIPGRDYLEKILQYCVDLPIAPTHLIDNQVMKAIDDAVSGIYVRDRYYWNFDEERVIRKIVRPLIKNMRDVRRYTFAIHTAVREFGKEIALVDILALEAVRIFLPDTFLQIQQNLTKLTTVSDRNPGTKETTRRINIDKETYQQLLDSAGKHSDAVQSFVKHVFQAGTPDPGILTPANAHEDRTLLERRVVRNPILRFYFERFFTKQLRTLNHAEEALLLLDDEKKLRKYLSQLDREYLPDVISSLEAYEDQFTPEHVVPGTIVLMRLMSTFPVRSGGVYSNGISFLHIISKLLRSLKDQRKVEEAVKEILSKPFSLSSKLELIETVGHRHSGYELVSWGAWQKFARCWRDEVRSTSVDDLIKEDLFVRILLHVKDDRTPEEREVQLDDSPNVTLALLRAVVRNKLLDSSGRFIRDETHLRWDILVELVGNEGALGERIKKLRASNPNDCMELLDLADQYVNGWRPDLNGDN